MYLDCLKKILYFSVTLLFRYACGRVNAHVRTVFIFKRPKKWVILPFWTFAFTIKLRICIASHSGLPVMTSLCPCPDWVAMELQSSHNLSILAVLGFSLLLPLLKLITNPVVKHSLKIWCQFRKHSGLFHYYAPLHQTSFLNHPVWILLFKNGTLKALYVLKICL